MKKDEEIIYVPENKSLPYLIGSGLTVSFILGLNYSPIKKEYYSQSIAPVVRVETVYVKPVISAALIKPKPVEEKIKPEAFGSRKYGWQLRNMSGKQMKDYLQAIGFRNLNGVNHSKLRRIWIAFKYDEMLMNVHYMTDFPVSMIYSFFIIEATNNGIETDLWRIHANAGGGKALKGYDHVTYKTREVINGKNKYIKAKFFSADNTEDGLKLWAQILNSGRYYECKKANYKLKGKRLYESICKCIYENGYHTDRDYKFRASLMAEYWEIKRDNFPKDGQKEEF